LYWNRGQSNPIPHSYIFLPSCKNWPSLFQLCMVELMEHEGEIIHEDFSSDIEEENDIEESDDNGQDDEDDYY